MWAKEAMALWGMLFSWARIKAPKVWYIFAITQSLRMKPGSAHIHFPE